MLSTIHEESASSAAKDWMTQKLETFAALCKLEEEIQLAEDEYARCYREAATYNRLLNEMKNDSSFRLTSVYKYESYNDLERLATIAHFQLLTAKYHLMNLQFERDNFRR